MSTSFLRGVSAIAVTLALAAAPAIAQTTPPAGTAPSPATPAPAATAGGGGTPGGNPAATTAPARQVGNGAVTGGTAPVAQGGKMESRVDQRISQLQRQLRITSAEEQQWNSFANVMRSNAQAMDQLWQQQMANPTGMTAPQSMQAYATLAQTHAQQAQQLVPAFQSLYDTLSPEQKEIADRAFSPRERPATARRGHGRGRNAEPTWQEAAPSKG